MSNDAERRFNEVFYGMIRLWDTVNNFRMVTDVGMLLGRTKIRLRIQESVEDLLSNPQNERLFIDKQAFIKNKEMIIDKRSDEVMKSASVTVDAFSIVFGHSILDANLDEFCLISATTDPAGWELRLEDRQLSFADIRKSSPDKLRDELLGKYLGEIRNKSVVRKCQTLYEQCKPPSGWKAMEDYVYNPEKLKEIDELRQLIVHGLILEPIRDVDDKLWFLQKTGIHFWTMLNFKYDLKLRRM